ncbi:MAG: hypothetical protein ACRC4M_05370 [Mycoplasma sp.]
MKIKKQTKKLMIFGSLLLVTTAVASTVAVACSNSSNPSIAVATSFMMTDGSHSFKLSRTSSTAISSNEKIPFTNADATVENFTSAPSMNSDLSKNSLAKQKAYSYFAILNNFTLWLQATANNVQDFISATTRNLISINSDFGKKLDSASDYRVLDLSGALSANLNDGKNTARLGLRSVDISLDLHNSIESNLLAFEAEKDKDKAYVDAVSQYTVSASNIKMNYEWWSTNKKNEILWKGPSFDINSQDLTYFKNLMSPEIGCKKPIATYGLGIDNIGFKWKNAYATKDENKLKGFYSAGVAEFVTVDETKIFKTTTLDEKQLDSLSNFFAEAIKRKQGDVVNAHFIDYVKSSDNASNVQNIFGLLKVY